MDENRLAYLALQRLQRTKEGHKAADEDEEDFDVSDDEAEKQKAEAILQRKKEQESKEAQARQRALEIVEAEDAVVPVEEADETEEQRIARLDREAAERRARFQRTTLDRDQALTKYQKGSENFAGAVPEAIIFRNIDSKSDPQYSYRIWKITEGLEPSAILAARKVKEKEKHSLLGSTPLDQITDVKKPKAPAESMKDTLTRPAQDSLAPDGGETSDAGAISDYDEDIIAAGRAKREIGVPLAAEDEDANFKSVNAVRLFEIDDWEQNIKWDADGGASDSDTGSIRIKIKRPKLEDTQEPKGDTDFLLANKVPMPVDDVDWESWVMWDDAKAGDEENDADADKDEEEAQNQGPSRRLGTGVVYVDLNDPALAGEFQSRADHGRERRALLKRIRTARAAARNAVEGRLLEIEQKVSAFNVSQDAFYRKESEVKQKERQYREFNNAGPAVRLNDFFYPTHMSVPQLRRHHRPQLRLAPEEDEAHLNETVDTVPEADAGSGEVGKAKGPPFRTEDVAARSVSEKLRKQAFIAVKENTPIARPDRMGQIFKANVIGAKIKSLRRNIEKVERLREAEKQNIGHFSDLLGFRKVRDLTARDGKIVLFEHLDPYPSLLLRFGMVTKLFTYYRRLRPKDTSGFKKNVWAPVTTYLPSKAPSPFLGDDMFIEPGNTMTVMSNRLYNAPVGTWTRTNRANDDFLIVVSNNKFWIRNIDVRFAVGQQFLNREVHTIQDFKRRRELIEERIRVYTLRFVIDSNKNSFDYRLVQQMFPDIRDDWRKKIIKSLAAPLTKSTRDSRYALRKDKSLPLQDSQLQALLSPEDWTVELALLHVARRLIDLGYEDEIPKGFGARANNKLSLNPPRDAPPPFLTTPWVVSQAVKDARENKTVLDVVAKGLKGTNAATCTKAPYRVDVSGRGLALVLLRCAPSLYDTKTEQRARRGQAHVQWTLPGHLNGEQQDYIKGLCKIPMASIKNEDLDGFLVIVGKITTAQAETMNRKEKLKLLKQQRSKFMKDPRKRVMSKKIPGVTLQQYDRYRKLSRTVFRNNFASITPDPRTGEVQEATPLSDDEDEVAVKTVSSAPATKTSKKASSKKKTSAAENPFLMDVDGDKDDEDNGDDDEEEEEDSDDDDDFDFEAMMTGATESRLGGLNPDEYVGKKLVIRRRVWLTGAQKRRQERLNKGLSSGEDDSSDEENEGPAAAGKLNTTDGTDGVVDGASSKKKFKDTGSGWHVVNEVITNPLVIAGYLAMKKQERESGISLASSNEALDIKFESFEEARKKQIAKNRKPLTLTFGGRSATALTGERNNGSLPLTLPRSVKLTPAAQEAELAGPVSAPVSEAGDDLEYSAEMPATPSKKELKAQNKLLKRIQDLSKSPLTNLNRELLHMVDELKKMPVDRHLRAYIAMFHTPVSRANLPVYYQIIERPIDLQTMKVKCRQGKYASLEEFTEDVERIRDNCIKFNSQNDLYGLIPLASMLVDYYKEKVLDPRRKQICEALSKAIAERGIGSVTDEKLSRIQEDPLGRFNTKLRGGVNHLTSRFTGGGPGFGKKRADRRQRAMHILEPLPPYLYPDYYRFIKTPMELQEMKNKATHHIYTTVAQFEMDLNLIYENTGKFFFNDASKLSVAEEALKQGRKWIEAHRQELDTMEAMIRDKVPTPAEDPKALTYHPQNRPLDAPAYEGRGEGSVGSDGLGGMIALSPLDGGSASGSGAVGVGPMDVSRDSNVAVPSTAATSQPPAALGVAAIDLISDISSPASSTTGAAASTTKKPLRLKLGARRPPPPPKIAPSVPGTVEAAPVPMESSPRVIPVPAPAMVPMDVDGHSGTQAPESAPEDGGTVVNAASTATAAGSSSESAPPAAPARAPPKLSLKLGGRLKLTRRPGDSPRGTTTPAAPDEAPPPPAAASKPKEAVSPSLAVPRPPEDVAVASASVPTSSEPSPGGGGPDNAPKPARPKLKFKLKKK
eukprot:Clim_evm31s99 gene=Clim_evmTU31s99